MHKSISSENQEPQGLRRWEQRAHAQSRVAVTGPRSLLLLLCKSWARHPVWAPVLQEVKSKGLSRFQRLWLLPEHCVFIALSPRSLWGGWLRALQKVKVSWWKAKQAQKWAGCWFPLAFSLQGSFHTNSFLWDLKWWGLLRDVAFPTFPVVETREVWGEKGKGKVNDNGSCDFIECSLCAHVPIVLHTQANCFCTGRIYLGLFNSLHYCLVISKHEFMTPGHFHFTDGDSEVQRDQVTLLRITELVRKKLWVEPKPSELLLAQCSLFFLMLREVMAIGRV